ncbi:MAG: pyruvate kinase alpha/beta domain-containing protein, partial [Campylobacterota bacterium]|nr:pyruvate kinase alpha/beta domain-containing protein [Campylobacterota bacterium]
AFTRSGKSAISISKFRPKQKILVSSYNIDTLRKLQVVWGIDAIFLSKKLNDTNELIKTFLVNAIDKKYISTSKNYVLTIGTHIHINHSTNDIRILDKQSIEYLIKHC